MLRKIIQIDQDKCNGCGLCAQACHEGAIDMVDGKAVLARESYCDGLGDCLPACPADAISFVVREAPAYDEAAVLASQQAKQAAAPQAVGGCPSSAARSFQRPAAAVAPAGGGCPGSAAKSLGGAGAAASAVGVAAERPSQLAQWPCQIKLVPVQAPFFADADLLIAADCTAFAHASFHERFMQGRVTIIGCPKLDGVDYTDKLAQIVALNSIRSVTMLRMEVPCCGGLERAARAAVQASGKQLPVQVVTISTDGRVLG